MNDAPAPLKRYETPLPVEGADGLFTSTWYAVCTSDDVGPGQVFGTEFLDGRVAIFRGADGVPHVVGAYCPHLGARLDHGRVEGNCLRCPFHGFEFDGRGKCVRTAIGAPPPPNARLFVFPTRERYGFIWAFNGATPLWDLPDLAYPDEELIWLVKPFGEMPADPFVLCSNTPDYHHFRTVHGLDWDHPDPDPRKDFRWTDHSFRFELKGWHWNRTPMHLDMGVYSTSIFFQQGPIGGRWYGFIAPFKIVRPGLTMTWFSILVPKGDGSPEALASAHAYAQQAMDLEFKFVEQDIPIFNGIHYRQGTLTHKDLALTMYLDMVRRQPRAHPSSDFIR